MKQLVHMKAWMLGALAGAAVALGFLAPASAAAQSAEVEVTSTAFSEGEAIPLRNSAYGDNVSPELSWGALPSGTRSVAMVLRDPDAPTPQPFVHWVVYGIPADAGGLPEGLPGDAVLGEPAEIAGTIQGASGLGRPGYFGPRPPAGNGAHRYIFSLYALDATADELGLEEGVNAAGLMEAIDGHVLGEGRLIGLFERE